jgi:hypothetical protein
MSGTGYQTDLHREKIAVEHGRGLHERLGDRHRGQLGRETAGLPDPALDLEFGRIIALEIEAPIMLGNLV